MVTIKADRAGLQLAQFGDVRRARRPRRARSARSARTASRPSSRSRLEPGRGEGHPRERRASRSCPPRCSARSTSRSSTRRPRPTQALSDGDVIPADRVAHQRRAQPDPGRPVPAAARDPARRPELHALRPGHRAPRPRRAARRDDGQARLLPQRRSTCTCRRCSRTWCCSPSVSNTYDIAAPDLVRLLRNVTDDRPHGDHQGAAARDASSTDVTGLGKTSTRVLTTNEAEHRPGAGAVPAARWACWTPTRPSSPACSRARPLRQATSARSSGTAGSSRR